MIISKHTQHYQNFVFAGVARRSLPRRKPNEHSNSVSWTVSAPRTEVTFNDTLPVIAILVSTVSPCLTGLKKRQTTRVPKISKHQWLAQFVSPSCMSRSAYGSMESERDKRDPGRASVISEFVDKPGKKVFSEPSSCGNGYVVVTSHPASEQAWPDADASLHSRLMEWRQLRFLEDPFQSCVTGCDQSVAKVAASPDGKVVARPDALALGYIKSTASVAICAAHACGAKLFEVDTSLRALVVGLGAGSLPLWLVNRFPNLQCHIVELDSTVARAAVKALGFPQGALRTQFADARSAAKDALDSHNDCLRAYICDGAEFVEALADQHVPGKFGYDIVVVDAFDKRGRVPSHLTWATGPFLKGLKKLLNPCAGVALNLLVDVTGSGASGGPQEVFAMTSAFHAATGGEVFSVRVPANESSNLIYGFTTALLPHDSQDVLQKTLQCSAEVVEEAINSNFSLTRRLAVNFTAGLLKH